MKMITLRIELMKSVKIGRRSPVLWVISLELKECLFFKGIGVSHAFQWLRRWKREESLHESLWMWWCQMEMTVSASFCDL